MVQTRPGTDGRRTHDLQQNVFIKGAVSIQVMHLHPGSDERDDSPKQLTPSPQPLKARTQQAHQSISGDKVTNSKFLQGLKYASYIVFLLFILYALHCYLLPTQTT